MNIVLCDSNHFQLIETLLKYLFLIIYLAVLSRRCSTRDLASLLRHVKSLVVADELLVAVCGI